jgi:hypothetical protein
VKNESKIEIEISMLNRLAQNFAHYNLISIECHTFNIFNHFRIWNIYFCGKKRCLKRFEKDIENN